MNAEINKLISATPIKLKFFYPKQEKIFKSYNLFRKFIENEYNFWSDCKIGNSKGISDQYEVLFSNIKSVENQYKVNEKLGVLWFAQAIESHVSNFNNRESKYNFYSKTPLSNRIRELSIENSTKLNAFLLYIQSGHCDTNNLVNLSAAIEADKYISGNEFSRKYIENYSEKLNETLSEYTNNINEIYSEYIDFHTQTSEKNDNFIQQVKNWKEEVIKEHTNYFETKKLEFDNMLEVRNKNFDSLENLYKEKLRLEYPAKYWHELEEKYRKEGRKWLLITLLLSIVLMSLLVCILYKIPEELKIKTIEFSLDSLRSTLLLAVIISIGIYLLRLFVKLAISAYHLSRDAKERYQLSYFYLSLIKDSAIDSGDRAIVLQSLFSRADTGLLKGDSSPTLPIDGLFTQFIKNVK